MMVFLVQSQELRQWERVSDDLLMDVQYSSINQSML